jgi:hypothetical protein
MITSAGQASRASRKLRWLRLSPAPCTVKESSATRCWARNVEDSLRENASERVSGVAGGSVRGASGGTMSHQYVSNVAFDPSRVGRDGIPETYAAER